MIRYSLLVLIFAVTTAAQPLQFGPATRVAPFSMGTTGRDYLGTVFPRVNGFAAYWQHDGQLWSESVSGSPPRPDIATAHSLGVYPDGIAETVNGPMIIYTDGSSTFVRALDEPASTATLVAAGAPDGIECNSTRCLVSVNAGNTLAVVDTNAQLVSVVAQPRPVAFREAWAADPNGFLFIATSGDGNHALSIDNSGNIRAEVKISPGPVGAATFNSDRYAVFGSSAAGVTAFTMTVDGQLSPARSIPAVGMRPQAVAWNGSEDLLILVTTPSGSIPEFVPPTAISGLRLGPDLAPIGAQRFQITPADGVNDATSVSWNGSMFYLVWTHSLGSLSIQSPSATVEGAAISANGDVVARDLVSWGSVPQTWPRVARGASSSIVVWSEFDVTSNSATLRYARNGTAVTVASGYATDVVPLGDDYLVAWADGELTRAAILSADGRWSPVSLPAISFANAAVAANHDHWLIAGSIGPTLVTVAIARDGTPSPPTVVAQLPFLYGVASDGDRFFLAAAHDFILDATGAPIAEKEPHGAAAHVDFAGGVYGALSGLGTLDRYDRDGNFIGSTKYAISDDNPTLSHIGSRFVIVDSFGATPTAAIVASDGTLVASGLTVPAVTIAKTDATTSTAVESRLTSDPSNRVTAALFVESVSSIPNTTPHRAVKH